jgi:hypothetical protein
VVVPLQAMVGMGAEEEVIVEEVELDGVAEKVVEAGPILGDGVVNGPNVMEDCVICVT